MCVLISISVTVDLIYSRVMSRDADALEARLSALRRETPSLHSIEERLKRLRKQNDSDEQAPPACRVPATGLPDEDELLRQVAEEMELSRDVRRHREATRGDEDDDRIAGSSNTRADDSEISDKGAPNDCLLCLLLLLNGPLMSCASALAKDDAVAALLREAERDYNDM